MASPGNLVEHDAWFVNESLAFYLSTSTFKNPVFDSAAEVAAQDAAAGRGPAPSPPAPQPAPRKPESSLMDQLNCLASKPKQRLELFCDNFLFAIKGKVFVLKLNFRHRLNKLRDFVSRRLGSAGLHKRQADTKQSSSSSSTASDQCQPASEGQKQQQQQRRRDLFWTKIKPPSSPKSLELQQARLLSRLKKAKRDSRRLLNTDNYLLSHFGELPVRELWEAQEELVAGGPSGGSGGGGAHGAKRSGAGPWSSAVSAPRQPPPRLLDGLLGQGAIGAAAGSSNNKSQLKWAPPAAGTHFGGPSRPEPSRPSVTKRCCIVCYANRPNLVTLPCEHNEICSDCFIELIAVAVKSSQYPLKCVLCRQKVERVRCSRHLATG